MNSIASTKQLVELIFDPISEYREIYDAKNWIAPLWFRGQADSKWPLLPGAFRKNSSGQSGFDEYNILEEMRLLQPSAYRQSDSLFDWLVYAQHYGVPTRLLDWSTSPLVGLYFATGRPDRDGMLFVLKPKILNLHTAMNLRSQGSIALPYLPDVLFRSFQATHPNFATVKEKMMEHFRSELAVLQILDEEPDVIRTKARLPIAVYPSQNNVRIRVQSGMFTIHGGGVCSVSGTNDHGPPVPLLEVNDGNCIDQFVIPGSKKERIRSELETLGISAGSLFPEFENQAIHIRDRWWTDG